MIELANLIWNPIILVVLFFVCLTFHFKEKGIIFTSYLSSLKYLRECLQANGDYSTKQIIMNSLGAVMGLGNIIGVATAIIMGGAGAIFYMFISGMIVTSLKYAEIKCSVRFHGGSPKYIKDVFHSRLLSYIYTLILLFSSMIMGTAIVSKTTSDLLYITLNVPIIISSIALFLVIFISIMINYRKVMEYNEILVPYMIGLFSIVSIGLCIFKFPLFYNSLKFIISEALNINAFIYGNGYAMIRYGIARGFFSNEAGFGTSTMLHGHSKLTPHQEAMVGVHEVLIDTNFMCVLVGIILVLSNVYHENAVMYVLLAFHKLMPHIGIPFIVLMVLFFGVAAMLGWYVIGKECVMFLSKRKVFEILYLLIYAVCIISAGIFNLEYIFKYSDLCNAVLLWINVIVLFKIYK